ncbi:MAG: hypothetical protein DDT19_00463 [Syntrophomonadaceae bacterium]|nr:hypothetical protein [Bacillota bacterium]
MLKRFLARVDFLTQANREKSAPDSLALISFMLNLFWFGVVGTLILRERPTLVFEIGPLTTQFFWLCVIISCSLLIGSRTSFLFAGTGLAALGFIINLETCGRVAHHELVWFLAGEAGEHIVAALCFALNFLFVSALAYLCLWFQAGENKFWARKALFFCRLH